MVVLFPLPMPAVIDVDIDLDAIDMGTCNGGNEGSGGTD